MSDLISRKAVMDEINSLTVTVTGLRAGKGVLNQFVEEYKKSVLRILDESPTAYEAPKKVYYFVNDDTFETTCCGTDVTNKDYNFCPNCGCELGEVEEVKGGLEE